MPENTVVTVKMMMEYLSKYPPYYKLIIYKPPYRMGYRLLAPRDDKTNPWMYSTRSVYVPIKEVKQFKLPKYNTYRKGIDGRSVRFTRKKKQQDRLRSTT